MNLLQDAMEPCVIMVPDSPIPDPEGGVIFGWAEGREFMAAFDFQNSVQAKIAEKQGVTGLWNIFVSKDVTLEYHHVFKRKSDGQTFRVTSKDDKATPSGSGLNLRVVSAEEWDLT